MPELRFEIVGIEPERFAASPLLTFKLRVAEEPDLGTPIHSVLLRCQIRIEPTRRRYAANEETRLFDVFGPREDWGRSLRSMLWTHTQVSVPGFTHLTTVDMPVPCTYDFNVAATKYFDALEGDDVPLCLLFSGTIFYADASGALQVSQISWECETNYRLPVRQWRELMDHYYPGSVWLRVPHEVYSRLEQFKRQTASTSLDQALERLLPSTVEQVVP